MGKKYVYLFSEGNANMRELLGGKGANLAEMTNIGLPVPQGFTITTEACTQYYEDGRQINDEIAAEIMEYVAKMEEITGKKFGDHDNPLLVSVRSGARASMPGMMDTILNLGLNETVVNTLAEKSNNPRWAWDCYRRFIQMYSDVVMEVGKKYFEQLIDAMKKDRGVTQDVELTAEDLKELSYQFMAEYKAKLGEDFPTDPKEQLMGAIKAVFRSWDNPRANVYRRDNDIPYSWGTAVNVQSMAFGNMGDDCGTGVAFTRNPGTGEKELFGEFLTNAQGEDVVAGVRTPMPISEMAEKFPEAFDEFEKVCSILETHYRDMQDMEFTVEHGKLYMLQCRNGKRTAAAALKIACDLVDEGMIDEKTAVSMIEPRNLDTLLHPQFDAAALKAATPIGKGLGASPGAACGKIVFSAEDAEAWKARGEKVVLVRLETSPEDITGMKASQGILTVRGGMTSHAAVVARGMGTCCVSGCGDITMDEENKRFTLAGKEFHEGDFISLDGSNGNIYDGIIPTVDATIGGDFGRIMGWADKYRRLKVRTNADTPRDARKARELGADDEQLEFPIVYSSGKTGVATLDLKEFEEGKELDFTPLLDTIVEYTPCPEGEPDEPLQLLVSNIDSDPYIGRIAIGRIERGTISQNQNVAVVTYGEEGKRNARIVKLLRFAGLSRQEISSASIGEIVCVAGIPDINIGDTICDPATPEAVPFVNIDEPTIAMTFSVNDSPYAAGFMFKFVPVKRIIFIVHD